MWLVRSSPLVKGEGKERASGDAAGGRDARLWREGRGGLGIVS